MWEETGKYVRGASPGSNKVVNPNWYEKSRHRNDFPIEGSLITLLNPLAIPPHSFVHYAPKAPKER